MTTTTLYGIVLGLLTLAGVALGLWILRAARKGFESDPKLDQAEKEAASAQAELERRTRPVRTDSEHLERLRRKAADARRVRD